MNSKPAAVILCGGESQRMGFPKWQLPFNKTDFQNSTGFENSTDFQQTLLERVVSIVRPEVSKIVLSINSQSTDLFAGYQVDEIVKDGDAGSGPLEGIRTALELLADGCESAFVTACDVPLLNASVIPELHKRLTEQYEAVIPIDQSKERRRVFGMTAVYRCSVHEKIRTLVDDGRLKVSALAEELVSRIVPMDEMQTFDRNLDSLSNINSPNDYFAVLEQLGLKSTTEVATILNRD